MYSPITPRTLSCMPPRKVIATTRVAQPGGVRNPVYHEAMHRVMGQVLRDDRASEASSEGLGPRIDVRSEGEMTTNDRGPA